MSRWTIFVGRKPIMSGNTHWIHRRHMDGGKWQGKTSRTISFLILRESMMDDWWVSQSSRCPTRPRPPFLHAANIEELLKARGSPNVTWPSPPPQTSRQVGTCTTNTRSTVSTAEEYYSELCCDGGEDSGADHRRWPVTLFRLLQVLGFAFKHCADK